MATSLTAEPSDLGAAAPARRRPAIVVVDDEPAVLAAVARDLRKGFGERYRVMRAGSGQEALDLLAEMRKRGDQIALLVADQKMPGLSGDVILRMATLSGAEALGWQAETGSLVAGKSADLVVVPLPQEDGHNYHLLWESTLPVRHVLMRGAWTSSHPYGAATGQSCSAWSLPGSCFTHHGPPHPCTYLGL